MRTISAFTTPSGNQAGSIPVAIQPGPAWRAPVDSLNLRFGMSGRNPGKTKTAYVIQDTVPGEKVLIQRVTCRGEMISERKVFFRSPRRTWEEMASRKKAGERLTIDDCQWLEAVIPDDRPLYRAAEDHLANLTTQAWLQKDVAAFKTAPDPELKSIILHGLAGLNNTEFQRNLLAKLRPILKDHADFQASLDAIETKDPAEETWNPTQIKGFADKLPTTLPPIPQAYEKWEALFPPEPLDLDSPETIGLAKILGRSAGGSGKP